LLQRLGALHDYIKTAEIERGFQRANRRELGGFLDGLRNANTNRDATVFVDRAITDEPAWADGGTYLAYLKIAQDLDRWSQLDQNAQQAAIGRSRDDGSRLDLPGNTNFDTEGDFTNDTCPVTAHIRKVGPRGELHDHTQIFRRGLPFVDLQADGTTVAGLQFVSFQYSLDAFATILHRWMLNDAFPQPGTGQDALLAQQILKFLRGAVFFVPPHDDRYIAAGLFDAVVPRCRNVGRIIVRKHVVDANNNPIPAELGGIGFQIFQDGNAVSEIFRTNSQGHATSPEVPIGPTLIVREVEPPANFTPAADVSLTLDCPRTTVHITDTATQPGSGYGG
jgi:Dyp-type peroxidase family/Prealbumin-like fold domain